MFSLFQVEGDSMSPIYTDGDYLLLRRFFRRLRVGERVVVEHDTYGLIVKEIARVSSEKGIQLTGTNVASVSSEKMGWCEHKQVIGKVVWLFKRSSQ